MIGTVRQAMSGLFEIAEAALIQWGRWSRQPLRWAPLQTSGMYSVLPIQHEPREPVEIELDPQSHRINVAVLSLGDPAAGVLWATYVRLIAWDSRPELFLRYGLDRERFDALLRRATVEAFLRAQDLTIAGDVAIVRASEGLGASSP